MKLSKLFKGNVQTNQKANNWKEAIEIAGKPLLERKIVKPGYIQQVLDRELKYPTGFPTKPTGIAIPHSLDRNMVIRPGIGVAIFPNDVIFIEIDAKME